MMERHPLDENTRRVLEAVGVEDEDGSLATAAHYLNQLAASSSPEDKEAISNKLYTLAEGWPRSHMFIRGFPAKELQLELLTSGTAVAKINAANTLRAVSKTVSGLRRCSFFRGWMPPLLSMLNFGSPEEKGAAAAAINAVTRGGIDGFLGTVLSQTDLVSGLWQQLECLDPAVDGLVTESLRDLCNSSAWPVTPHAGAEDILVKVLKTGSSTAQANACSLLACLMTDKVSSGHSRKLALNAGAVQPLLKLLEDKDDVFVRAEAAGALRALSFDHGEASQAIEAAGGVSMLIAAVASRQSELLQENALAALANICGGLWDVISNLVRSVEATSDSTEAIGALAYALKVADKELKDAFDPAIIERILVKKLGNMNCVRLVLEALDSLYRNSFLVNGIQHADAKKMIVGLLVDHEERTKSLMKLCGVKDDLWRSFCGQQGVKLLISLLQRTPDSSEQQQEYAVALLSTMCRDETDDDCKCAIIAAAGTLPLIELLQTTGSVKAREDSAAVLGSLCRHSEEIRVYVLERADAVTAFLWLLRNAAPEGQEVAAQTLMSLVRSSDDASILITQLGAMLTGRLPKSKLYVLDVVACVLSVASRDDIDLLRPGTAACSALDAVVRLLNAGSGMDTQARAAAVLADFFNLRRDVVAKSQVVLQSVEPLIDLVGEAPEATAAPAARALAEVFRQVEASRATSKHAMLPLISLASSSSSDATTEAAITALAYLLQNQGIVEEAPAKEIVPPLTRVLREGSPDGRETAARALVQLLNANRLDDAFADSIRECGTFQALVALLGAATPQVLEALVLLARANSGGANLNLNFTKSSTRAFERLVLLLDSPPSEFVRHLAVELLSLLLAEEHFQKDTALHTQLYISPLVKLVGAGAGVGDLQRKALKALERASNARPNAVGDTGGIAEVSKVILQVDLQPFDRGLWESAASVLSNILRFSSQFSLQVAVTVLVKLLRSTSETTAAVALDALLNNLVRGDGSSAELMAESGAVEAVLELSRCHRCEKAAARLLEALLNNVKVRDKLEISSLLQYLRLDPHTRSQRATQLVASALEDIFRNGLSRTTDAVLVCRALVSLLENQPTEEMKMAAVYAQQNLVRNSRSVPETICVDRSSSSCGQSSEIIQALSDLWFAAAVSEDDTLRAMKVLFLNFPRLRGAKETTLCIPQLVAALEASSSEAAQAAALDCLTLLSQGWSSSPGGIGRAQSTAVSEAIPVLQRMTKSGPQHFREKADSLLQCLPGVFVVVAKRGINLKHCIGSVSSYCKITLGNGPPQQTKVVSHTSEPCWSQEFVWNLETPPKGQKLHISCKSKGAFGERPLGEVTIDIDRVVTAGSISGQYRLNPNKDSARILEIEFKWSNKRV